MEHGRLPARRTGGLGSPRRAVLCPLLLGVCCGCYAIRNAWLDPSVVGNFTETTTTEIRSSLSLEDLPTGIPGSVFPGPEDLIADPTEVPIVAGDTLAIEINELRQPLVPFQAEVLVSALGDVNLPVVGRVSAAERTVPEFEAALVAALQERNILVEPDVTVNPIFLQNATYSIFGIGVSAATDAPLRAGTFPIRRPDLRILEAINQVGGLNEFVTDVYVFRSDPPVAARTSPHETEPAGRPHLDPPPDEDLPDEKDPRGTRSQRVLGPLDEPKSVIHAAVWYDPRQDQRAGLPVAEKAGVDDSSLKRPIQEDDAREFAPDPMQPFLYVNGEFVPNPAYRRNGPGTRNTMAPGALDTVIPAVNWARIAGDVAYRIIRIPAELLRTGDPQVNIVVRPGDVIRIVSGEIGVYYVMGQVNRVGAFAFNAEPITLKSAIAAAGGLSSLAWPDRCTIYRRIGRREQMIQVNLDRIFAGVDDDFYIKRGDIINVGTHPLAPFLQSLRGLTVPNPVSNIGYSFTYARNFADIDSFAVQQNPRNRRNPTPPLFR